MNRKRHLVLSFALILGAAVVRADDIDDYVKAAMQQQHIPAVSVAVIKDGAVIKAEGYGLADIEHDIPARPTTVFKIGSVSKQFIATGIMLLVQDGRVALDDKVSKYLAETPVAWQAIALRHLLTHTSGLVREAPGFDPHKIQPDIDVIKTAYPLPLRFKPGEKWEYCNVGYFVLAEIIHRVSGKPWGDFLTERVFAPLGMTATRVTSAADIVPNRADGYAWIAGIFQNMQNWPAVRPSGAFLSTVLDLATWEAALLADHVLKGSTKTEMWTPVTLNDGRKYPYGFGWQLDDFPAGSKTPSGVPMIRHGGTMPGFRAAYFRWPSHGLTVVVLTNLENAPVEGLGANIAIRYVPELKLALLPPPTAPNPR
ncbi:MAG: serine hydrolase domain-containing protein [Bryobacteraceae bacterium]